MFVLLELTKDRYECEALANILIDCEQKNIGYKLSEINSLSPFPIINETFLEVRRVKNPVIEFSTSYNLIKNPRGHCILVNNRIDCEDELNLQYKLNENERMAHLFKSLGFSVHLLIKYNIQNILEFISERITHFDLNEALIVFITSYGNGESFFGYDASMQLLNSHHEIDLIRFEYDSMKITDFVHKIAEKNNLSNKVKIFFFNNQNLMKNNSGNFHANQ